MKAFNRSVTVWFLAALVAGFVMAGCGEEGTDEPESGPLTVEQLLGTWDMNLAETHPDIFVTAGGLIRTVEDTEWATLEIGPGAAVGYVKLKESAHVYQGTKNYEIIDGRYLHIFNVAQGWEDTFKAVLQNEGNKLVFVILPAGADPEYPNGVYEVYDRRL